jgi:hypothetical protein
MQLLLYMQLGANFIVTQFEEDIALVCNREKYCGHRVVVL